MKYKSNTPGKRRVYIALSALCSFVLLIGTFVAFNSPEDVAPPSAVWSDNSQLGVPGRLGQGTNMNSDSSVSALPGDKPKPKNFEEDPTVHFDAEGYAFFVEELPSAEIVLGDVLSGSDSGLDIPLDQTFELQSRPSSQRTIYLNFVGGTVENTRWNVIRSMATIEALPFDLDGDTSTFSDAEKSMIIDVWQRVSEDYAIFDVNVTTKNLGYSSINRANASDQTYGTTAMITSSEAPLGCNCGGVAFLDTFDVSTGHDSFQPAWVFMTGNAKYIAETVTHEVGHTLGLSHDGNLLSKREYELGHGSWAPIMGESWYRPVSQWSSGEYLGANNTEDDITIMSSNGLSLLADDVGDTLASSVALTTGTTRRNGLISTRADKDVFTFATSGGPFSATISPAEISPNIYLTLELLDVTGAVLSTTSNEQISTGDGAGYAVPIAPLSATLASGTYYLRVDGIGQGTVDTGFSDYGSLGRYSLSVSVPDATKPSITNFDVDGAYPGGEFHIRGKGFSSTTSVTIGEIAASFSVLSNTDIQVVVPDGASSNFVNVTTGAGSVASPQRFIVYTGDLSELSFTFDSTDSSYKFGTLFRAIRHGGSAVRGLRCRYQWAKDGVDVPRAYDLGYTTADADVGGQFTADVRCTAPNREPYVTTVAAPNLVTRGYLPYSGPPTLSGVMKVGETITLNTGTYSPTPDSITVTWGAYGIGAFHTGTDTSIVIPNSIAGRQIWVFIRATKANYLDFGRGTLLPSNPVMGGTQDAPTVSASGDNFGGGILRCESTNVSTGAYGTVVGWRRDGLAITDSANWVYTTTASDEGHRFACVVKFSKFGYDDLTVSSSETAALGAPPVVELARISGIKAYISGFASARVGDTLLGNYYFETGDMALDSVHYEWFRNGVSVGTGSRYTITNDDAGNSLTLAITATKANYLPTIVEYSTDTVTGGIFTSGAVSIVGVPRVGETLSAVVTGFSPIPDEITYTWMNDDTVLQQGTSPNYTVTASDVASTIRVSASYSKTGFVTAGIDSEIASRVSGGTLSFSSPTVTGTPIVGNELTLNIDRPWTDERVSIAWYRGTTRITALDGNYVYSVGPVDVGKQVKAVVTFSRNYYDDQVFTISASGLVAKARFSEFTVSVDGHYIAGLQLNAEAFTGLTSLDGVEFSYQWLRDGQAIVGEDKVHYFTTSSDIGHSISVSVAATKDGYERATGVTSGRIVQSAGVAVLNGVNIKGTPKVGKTLTAIASPGQANTVLTYQWRRNGSPIANAIGKTYKIAKSDNGKKIGVTITASVPNFTSSSSTYTLSKKVAK